MDGAKYPVSEGSIVFVPPGTWHGFIASDGGMDGVGFVSPAGLEGFFRDLDRLTDGGKKEPSIDELNRIGRKYGDVYRVSQ